MRRGRGGQAQAQPAGGASLAARQLGYGDCAICTKPQSVRRPSIRGAVLDPFGGSGSTLMAAGKIGRRARLVEFDPAYCDQIVRRFERLTGKSATLAATGQSFEAVAQARAVPCAGAPEERS
jgi:DNA methylase